MARKYSDDLFISDHDSSDNAGAGAGADEHHNGSGSVGQQRDDSVSSGSGGNESDSGELPIGIPGGDAFDARRNDPARKRGRRKSVRAIRKTIDDGSGDGRGRSSASDTGLPGLGESTETVERARSVDENVPREVGYGSLASPAKGTKNSSLTKEFIAEGWKLVFDGCGFVLQDKEWTIDVDTDAAELADRTLNWLRGLDKNKTKNFERIAAKWQPFLMLVMALVAIVGPRIAHTRKVRQNARIGIQKTPGKDTGKPAPIQTAAPVAPGESISAAISRSSNGRTSSEAGPTNAGHRPFRADDFLEVFGPDV